MKPIAFLWIAVTASAMAEPAASSDDVMTRIATERQHLQAERTAIEQTNDAMQRECWQRFAVNDCLREVRRKRHAALDPLRSRELELNAQERAWRTQQRDERLTEKENSAGRKP